MKLGELFFALTVKGTGDEAIARFDDAVVGAHDTAVKFEIMLEQMIFLFEKMAVRIKAVTEEQINKFKEDQKEQRELKETVKVTERKISLLTKLKIAIMGVSEKTKGHFQALNEAKTALIGTSAAIMAFSKSASDMAVSIDKIQSFTGLSTDAIQQLKGMIEQTGGSIEDVSGALRHFQEEAVNISLGRGGNIGAWQFMGVDPRQNPLTVMSQLQHKLKTMPMALGNTIGKDLGLSDDLIYFLRNSDALQPTSKEMILSDSEIKRLKTFNFEFNKVWSNSKFILSKLGAFITPLANQILYAASRMSHAINTVINAITPFMSQIERFAPAIALLFAGMAAKLWPAKVALALMALVLEDLITYLNGGDSVIGRWVNMFKEINNWVTAIKVGIGAILDAITGGKFTESISDMLFDPKKFAKDSMENLSMIGKHLGIIPMSSAPATAAATTNNVNIQVDGSKDPKATGAEVVKQFKKAVGDSYFQQPQGGH
jgi:hypothetical protein